MSPSAENRETFEPVGKLCLPRLSLAYSLLKMANIIFLSLSQTLISQRSLFHDKIWFGIFSSFLLISNPVISSC